MKRVTFPLLTVLSLAVLGLVAACGGGAGADPSAAATQAAGMEPATEITIVARGMKFEQKVVVAAAGQDITIHFDNQDRGGLHNVAIYTDDGAREAIYRGELFTGRGSMDYTFTAPEPGTYFFRCDAHPEMHGSFIAR